MLQERDFELLKTHVSAEDLFYKYADIFQVEREERKLILHEVGRLSKRYGGLSPNTILSHVLFSILGQGRRKRMSLYKKNKLKRSHQRGITSSSSSSSSSLTVGGEGGKGRDRKLGLSVSTYATVPSSSSLPPASPLHRFYNDINSSSKLPSLPVSGTTARQRAINMWKEKEVHFNNGRQTKKKKEKGGTVKVFFGPPPSSSSSSFFPRADTQALSRRWCGAPPTSNEKPTVLAEAARYREEKGERGPQEEAPPLPFSARAICTTLNSSITCVFRLKKFLADTEASTAKKDA